MSTSVASVRHIGPWSPCLLLLSVLLVACRGPEEVVDPAARASDLGLETRDPPAAPGDTPPAARPEEGPLDFYLRAGLARNAALRAAFERWRAAVAALDHVGVLPDPRLSYGYYLESVETRTGPQEHVLGLSQAFPWFGVLEARVLRQEAAAARLWAEVEARRLATSREIRDAWFEYVYIGEALRIAEDHLALLRRLEPVAQRRIEGGGGQEDLLRLQVEIGRLENEAESLEESRAPVSARLRAAMSWPGESLLPWPERAEFEELDRLVDSLDGLERQVLARNPRLEAERAAVRESAAAIDLAELEGGPAFSLAARTILTGRARADGVRGSGDDPLLVTLSLELPVQRGRDRALVREARAGRGAAIADLRARRDALSAAFAQARYAYEDADRQVALYRESLLPRARQALEVTEVAYRTGRADLTDVVDSQRNWLAFQRAFARGRTDRAQAHARLLELAGGAIR